MPKKYTLKHSNKHSNKHSKKHSRTYHKKSRNRCHSRRKFYGGNNNGNNKLNNMSNNNSKNVIQIERGKTTNSIGGYPVISKENVIAAADDGFVGTGKQYLNHQQYRNFQGPEQ